MNNENECNEMLAYIAGIIDGEGTISFRHPAGCSTYQVYVAISNTDTRLMHRLSLIYEGQVYQCARELPRHKPIFKWTLTGERAVSFIKLIKPYLFLKLQQAEEVLAYQELKDSYGIHSGVVAPEEFLKEAKVMREAVLILNARGKEE